MVISNNTTINYILVGGGGGGGGSGSLGSKNSSPGKCPASGTGGTGGSSISGSFIGIANTTYNIIVGAGGSGCF